MGAFTKDSKPFPPGSDQEAYYLFGTFRLYPTRFVLLRDEERIPIAAKSLDTLLALVARHGETVTKSELLSAVWGNTAVEENRLNQCVSGIRRALGERRGQHDYIVTVTGVGYRFVAPVTNVIATDAQPSESLPEPAPPPDPGSQTKPVWQHIRVVVATAALLAVATAIFAIRGRTSGPGSLSTRRTAVILSLKNLSGTADTAWLSTAVAEMLYHELAGPGKLRLIPLDNVARMERDLPQRRTPSEALEDVRTYTGADLALAGAVTVLSGEPGTPLRIDLHIQDLRSGDVIATTSVNGSEGETFDMVRTLADRVRQSLGMAVAGSPERRSPIPTSGQAMQLYSYGMAALHASDFVTAKDRLLQAVAADPSNALCYSALSSAWNGLGYDANALEAARHAFELSSALDRLDSMAIEGRYRLAAHEWLRASRIYETIWNLVPESIEDGQSLVDAYGGSGKIEEAKRVVRRFRSSPEPLRDDPRIDMLEARVEAYSVSGYAHIAVLARSAAEKARSRGMRDLYARALLLESGAMLTAGQPGSQEIRSEARRLCDELHDWMCVARALRVEGNQNLLQERLREAADGYAQALAIARQSGNLSEALQELNGLALVHGKQGDFEAAGREYDEALRIEGELSIVRGATHINYAEVLRVEGRLGDSRRELEAALQVAQAGKEIESEANSLAGLAGLDLIGGDPRNAVARSRKGLALAQRSGSYVARSNSGFALAMALAATGETGAARDVLRTLEPDCHAVADRVQLEFGNAQLAFDEAKYPEAERLSRQASEDARTVKDGELETQADTILANVGLAQGHLREARDAASRALAVPPTQQSVLSRLEARLAYLMAGAQSGDAPDALAGVEAVAVEARKLGYTATELEARWSAAGLLARAGRKSAALESLGRVASDASAKGYAVLAARARNLGASALD